LLGTLLRRSDLVKSMEAIGGDITFVLGEDEDPHDRRTLSQRVVEATADGEIVLGLDAVGGYCAQQLADCLCEGGTLVTYGCLTCLGFPAPQIPVLEEAVLRCRQIKQTLFDCDQWWSEISDEDRNFVHETLASLISSGQVSVPVSSIFPSSEAQVAVAHAQNGGNLGRTLIELDGSTERPTTFAKCTRVEFSKRKLPTRGAKKS